jgi:hypothetical protein
MENQTNNFPPPPEKNPPLNNIPGLFDKTIHVNTIHDLENSFADSVPTFFLITRTEPEMTFKTVSPFKISRFLDQCKLKLKSVKRLRDGSLLIESGAKESSEKLTKINLLGTFPVSVSPHTTLNSSRGVVYSHDLMGLEEQEIKEELKLQHVIDVKPILTRKDNILKRSPLHILTFDTTSIPNFIFAGFVRIPVRPHIPNPLRCLNCQRFGHGQQTCKKTHVCGQCGKSEVHEGAPCDQDVQCANCSAPHTSWSRDCPIWKKEKKIAEIKTLEKLTYPDARKKYDSLHPVSPMKSFSQATAQAATNTKTHKESLEIKEVLEKMSLLLAGQQEAKTLIELQSKKLEEQSKKLEEQSKILEEQSKKISEQSKEIASLRKENEELRRITESDNEQIEKKSAKKLKRDEAPAQASKGVEQKLRPIPEDSSSMEVDNGSTDKLGRKPHSRIDFPNKS